MLRKKKIPCYILVFDQTEIIKKTLDSLVKKVDKLDIVIVENPSKNTSHIKKYIEELGVRGLVKRHYLFEKNITNNALRMIFLEERKLIKKSKYMILTDGDLVPDNENWLEEEIEILKQHRDVFGCGISLDMSNLPLETFPDAVGWIPPDKQEFDDYYEALTGGHLVIMRGKEFDMFSTWRDQHKLPQIDGQMHRFAYEVLHKKWARTKRSKAYHLTWDLYHDKNHPYTRMKMEKSFQETWHHAEESPFTLTSY